MIKFIYSMSIVTPVVHTRITTGWIIIMNNYNEMNFEKPMAYCKTSGESNSCQIELSALFSPCTYCFKTYFRNAKPYGFKLRNTKSTWANDSVTVTVVGVKQVTDHPKEKKQKIDDKSPILILETRPLYGASRDQSRNT